MWFDIRWQSGRVCVCLGASVIFCTHCDGYRCHHRSLYLSLFLSHPLTHLFVRNLIGIFSTNIRQQTKNHVYFMNITIVFWLRIRIEPTNMYMLSHALEQIDRLLKLLRIVMISFAWPLCHGFIGSVYCRINMFQFIPWIVTWIRCSAGTTSRKWRKNNGKWMCKKHKNAHTHTHGIPLWQQIWRVRLRFPFYSIHLSLSVPFIPHSFYYTHTIFSTHSFLCVGVCEYSCVWLVPLISIRKLNEPCFHFKQIYIPWINTTYTQHTQPFNRNVRTDVR